MDRNFSFSLFSLSWFISFRFTYGNDLSISVEYLFGIKLMFVENLFVTTLDSFALLLWADFMLCLDSDRGRFGLLTVMFLCCPSGFERFEALLGGFGGTADFLSLFLTLMGLFWLPCKFYILFALIIDFFCWGSVRGADFLGDFTFSYSSKSSP